MLTTNEELFVLRAENAELRTLCAEFVALFEGAPIAQQTRPLPWRKEWDKRATAALAAARSALS